MSAVVRQTAGAAGVGAGVGEAVVLLPKDNRRSALGLVIESALR
jgi:hypothetical protein